MGISNKTFEDVADERDSLRAERDTWRNVAESHEPATSLRQAEFARMDLEVGRLRAELAEAKARIAKLEEALHVTLDEREEEMTRAERAWAQNRMLRSRLSHSRHSYVDGIPSDQE